MEDFRIMAVKSCIDTLQKLGMELKPAPATAISNSAVHIQIEFIGDIKGYVILESSKDMAIRMANVMLQGMMTVENIDDMTKSVLSEICNMVSGNLSTSIASLGYVSDIKPPIIDIRETALPADKGTTLKYTADDGQILNAYFVRIG